MGMVETIIAGIIIALSVAIIMAVWKRIVTWKNDERRKYEGMVRRASKKHDRQLRKELWKAGVPKDEF